MFVQTRASALALSAGLTARKTLRLLPPGAGSRRLPQRNQPIPKRGKRLAGSPTSAPNPEDSGWGREEECNFFHRFGVGSPRSGLE